MEMPGMGVAEHTEQGTPAGSTAEHGKGGEQARATEPA